METKHDHIKLKANLRMSEFRFSVSNWRVIFSCEICISWPLSLKFNYHAVIFKLSSLPISSSGKRTNFLPSKTKHSIPSRSSFHSSTNCSCNETSYTWIPLIQTQLFQIPCHFEVKTIFIGFALQSFTLSYMYFELLLFLWEFKVAGFNCILSA